jgi:putative spermidine/putrescine transport system permease protein
MGRVVRTIAACALIFGVLPTVVVVIASFSSERALSFPPRGLSFRPYVDLMQSDILRDALLRSVIVATESMLLALPIGTIGALALFRHRLRLRSLLLGYIMLGFSTPLIVSGMAFLVLFIPVGVFGTVWSTALALTIVNLPFLVFAVASSVVNLNPDLEDAAATLGADKVEAFLFVTLPGVMPGVITGSILMFIFGLTEFLVSLILSTTSNQTFPVALFGSLRGAVSPMLAAGGAIYIAIAFVVVFAMSRFRFLDNFLSRND